MEKKDIKNILISMRTPENEPKVNFLLGQIDMLSKEQINQHLSRVENSDKNIINLLQEKLQTSPPQITNKHTPINQTFTYGISGNCIHLHFPKKSYSIIKQSSISKTFGALHLNLLDAIDKIRILRENGFYQFSNANEIFMISPKLSQKTLAFLEEMNFQTTFYREKDLKNPEFVEKHPESQLGLKIFGSDSDFKNLGTAHIGLDVLSTPEWQAKYKAKIKEFNEKGIFLEQKEKE